MKTKSKRLLIKIIAAILILLLPVIISNYALVTTEYNFNKTEENGVKIAFISDLHGKKFGFGNSLLVNKLSQLNPDIICLGGDFIDEDNTSDDNEELIELVSQLVKIAPTYYSYGNHDLHYFRAYGKIILDAMSEAGCTVLEEKYVDITVGNIDFRLGGMYDYAFNIKDYSEKNWSQDSTNIFLADFTDTDKTKILLCHRPDCFIFNDTDLVWDIDYILSGHTHGGIWQIPFTGGLIAPAQGFFPEYDKGEFSINDSRMIISSGLAGYNMVPRLFNCPEITIIEFNED